MLLLHFIPSLFLHEPQLLSWSKDKRVGSVIRGIVESVVGGVVKGVIKGIVKSISDGVVEGVRVGNGGQKIRDCRRLVK